MLQRSLLFRPNESFVGKLNSQINVIIDAISQGHECEEQLSEFGALAGSDEYSREFFETLDSHSTAIELAEQVGAQKCAYRIEDITRGELVHIVQLAMELEYPDTYYYMELFDKNVPLSNASNLIFYPPCWKNYQNLEDYHPSAEQIVDWATDQTNVVCL